MPLRFHFPDLTCFLSINGVLSINAYIPRGMFPLTMLTRLMFVLMLGIVFLTLKLARPEKIFKMSQKHIKFKHSRGDSLLALLCILSFILINHFN